jgi:Kef-type K+ transport system membrane component KefB
MIGLVVLAALALLGGSVAHRLGFPRFVGGVGVGLLCGVSVLGQVWPTGHAWLFEGGFQPQQKVAVVQAEFEAQRQMLLDSGVTDVAIDEARAETQRRVASLQAQAEAERQSLSLERQAWGGVLGWVLLLAAGACMRRMTLQGLFIDGLPMAVVAIIVVGLGAWAGHALAGQGDDALGIVGLAAVAGLGAIPLGQSLARSLGGVDAVGMGDLPQVYGAGALMLALVLLPVAGAACGIGHGEPWQAAGFYVGMTVLAALVIRPLVVVTTRRMRRQTGDATALVVVCLLAIALLVVTAVMDGVVLWWPWAVAAGWAVAGRGVGHIAQRAVSVLAPLIAALIALQIDLAEQFRIWVLLGLVVLLGDGKAVAGMLAARFAGNRTWPDALRVGVALSSGGAVALVAAVALRQAGLIGAVCFSNLILAIALQAILAGLVMRWLGPSAPPPVDAG